MQMPCPRQMRKERQQPSIVVPIPQKLANHDADKRSELSSYTSMVMHVFKFVNFILEGGNSSTATAAVGADPIDPR